ncbi:hypothetical protein D3C85_1075110 [compost metagenome]
MALNFTTLMDSFKNDLPKRKKLYTQNTINPKTTSLKTKTLDFRLPLGLGQNENLFLI